MERDKHSISIRINGKERDVLQFPKGKNEETFEQKETELHSRPDNVVDFVKAHEEQKLNSQPYWDDGNREASPRIPLKRKKKWEPPRRKLRYPVILIAAFVSAILVGIALGFIVLMILTGTSLNEDIAAGTDEIGSQSASIVNEHIRLPSLQVEVVQAGAFSSMEKGEQMVTDIKDEGYAAVLSTVSNPLSLIVGISNHKDEAKRIAEQFSRNSKETYVKSYVIDGSSSTLFTEEAIQWFENGLQIHDQLLTIVGKEFSGDSLQGNEALNDVREELHQWKENELDLFANIPNEMKEEVNQFSQSLIATKDELIKFEESKDEKILWQVQQNLLETINHYDAIVRLAQSL